MVDRAAFLCYHLYHKPNQQEKTMPVLSGTAYWASITTPNTKYTPVYQVNLATDSDTVASFKDKGYSTKVIDDQECLILKRKVSRADGTPNETPRLMDKYKNPLDITVGNGSKVKVQYRPWETTNSYGTFKGLDLQALQVIELVESGTMADGSELTAEPSLEDEL